MEIDPFVGVELGGRRDVVKGEDPFEEVMRLNKNEKDEVSSSGMDERWEEEMEGTNVVVVELSVEFRVFDGWVGLREDSLLWKRNGAG